MIVFELFRQRFHLLGGNVLTRHIDMLIKSHGAAFPFHMATLGAEPFEPRKGSIGQTKAETPGKRIQGPCPPKRVPVQPPAEVAKAFYTRICLGSKARRKGEAGHLSWRHENRDPFTSASPVRRADRPPYT